MKRNIAHLTGIASLVLFLPVSAETIYSGLIDTPIPTNFDGVTLTIGSGVINPFFGGVAFANNSVFQPGRTVAANLGTLQNFAVGATIDGSMLLGTLSGGSEDHVGTTFTAGTEGYIGFKNGSNYGWMRVLFTNNTTGALIKEWAYDDGAAAIAVANITQTGSVVTADSTYGDFTVASVVADVGGATSFVKTGTGTTTLKATNTYTGATSVNAGKLLINGNVSTSSFTTVASLATVGGTGSMGGLTVQSGGFVAPGGAAANSTGALTVNGNYTQAGTFNADLKGTTPATNYDQIIVVGAVDITGGALAATFSGFTPVNGDMLFILLNDGTDAITGTYAGYAQGAVVSNYGGFDWQISYEANSGSNAFLGGNDIALVAIPEPSIGLLGSLSILGLALLRRR